MKMIVCERYGPPEVLQRQEAEKPRPGDTDVLIRIRTTTVTAGDRRVRAFDIPSGMRFPARLALGITRPRNRVLGTEFAGEVEAIGSRVTRFSVGDRVFAFPGSRMGGYAEYKCMPEGGLLARIPANLDVENAAALSFGGTTALHFFRKAGLNADEEVLVIGASGGVGTAAVQLARHTGANVTGVCSTGNMELVRSLGAATVIDYTRDDVTARDNRYDVIMDTIGAIPAESLLPLLNQGGRLLLVAAGLHEMMLLPGKARRSGARVIAGPASERPEDLRYLADLAGAGVFSPVIDRRYSLEEIIQAHHYVDTGRKRGNVVVTVGT